MLERAPMSDAPAAPKPEVASAPRKATLTTMLASPKGLWRFLRDPQTPRGSKLLAMLTLAYVVSPLDVIPDWIVPVLGWFDDVGITAAALAYIASQAARYANEHPTIEVRPAKPEEKPSAR